MGNARIPRECPLAFSFPCHLNLVTVHTRGSGLVSNKQINTGTSYSSTHSSHEACPILRGELGFRTHPHIFFLYLSANFRRTSK